MTRLQVKSLGGPAPSAPLASAPLLLPEVDASGLPELPPEVLPLDVPAESVAASVSELPLELADVLEESLELPDVLDDPPLELPDVLDDPPVEPPDVLDAFPESSPVVSFP